MITQLNDKVWFGDWQSPVDGAGFIKSIINVAHHFNPRRGRGEYWPNMQSKVPWEVLYFRLAKKDADDIDEAYAKTFRFVIEAIKVSNAFPLLCHCQMGGHRGPTAALHAAVLLGYDLKDTHHTLLNLRPRLNHPKRPERQRYYPSTVAYLTKMGYGNSSSES